MRYVVAYDITSDSSRQKVSDLLAALLVRVQYSVFEGESPAKVLAATIQQAIPHLDPETDSLRVYRLCGACSPKIEIYGRRPDLGDEPVVIL